MASRQTEYIKLLRSRLIAQLGHKCVFCSELSGLEFAHLSPDGLSGQGRGRAKRYLAIQRNPDNYVLLCKDCHTVFDSQRQPAEYLPVWLENKNKQKNNLTGVRRKKFHG